VCMAPRWQECESGGWKLSFIKTRPHLGNSMNDDVNDSCLIELSLALSITSVM